MTNYPDAQNLSAGAIPVRLVTADGTGFYTASGGSGGATAPYVATPLGYQQITGLGSATGLTVPNGATFCYISVESAGVRYRDDGTNPTATVGMPLLAGTAGFLYSGNLAAIKFIQTTAGAVVDVSYYQ